MASAPWLRVTGKPAPVVLDGCACRARAAFFAEAARVLQFPAYFGHNWDALVDCLRDERAVDLAVAHAEYLLVDEPSTQLAILLKIMVTAAADGLTLALHAGPGQDAVLRRRVEAALR